jgi:hypothetical protein
MDARKEEQDGLYEPEEERSNKGRDNTRDALLGL